MRFVPGCKCCAPPPKICFNVITCQDKPDGTGSCPLQGATIEVRVHGSSVIAFSGTTDATGTWCFTPGTNSVQYDYTITSMPWPWVTLSPTGSVWSNQTTDKRDQTVMVECAVDNSYPKWCCRGQLVPRTLHLFDGLNTWVLPPGGGDWGTRYTLQAQGRSNSCQTDGPINLTVQVYLSCNHGGSPYTLQFIWYGCGGWHNADDATTWPFINGQNGSIATAIPASYNPFYLQFPAMNYPARPGFSVGNAPELETRTITITG